MAEEENGEAPKLPPDARLDSLEQRLARAHEAEAKRTGRAQPNPNYGLSQAVVGYLIGGPLGGGLIGWGLDSLTGTFPLFLLLLLFMGFGVGIWSVIRLSKTLSGSGRSTEDLKR